MKKLENLIKEIKIRVVLTYLCSKIILLHLRGKKVIAFIATPLHGNLGDQAIVYAQYLFFESLGVKNQIVEIHRSYYERWKCVLQKMLYSTDIIVSDGGGNMGTLWLEEEKKMQEIALRFDHNPVFVFPQTSYYSNDETGKRELIEARKAYGINEYFFVFARDKKTFDFLSENMPEVSCMYTPDMVMLIENAQSHQKRDGVAFCLRNDLERMLTEEQRDKLNRYFNENGIRVTELSTVVPFAVRTCQREKILRAKWKEFSSTKLVITDRLHGMVFAAITGTPCIAIDNISHKVYGAYQWLSYLPYLRFCDNINSLEKDIIELLKMESNSYYISPLLDCYKEMQKIVRSKL